MDMRALDCPAWGPSEIQRFHHCTNRLKIKAQRTTDLASGSFGTPRMLHTLALRAPPYPQQDAKKSNDPNGRSDFDRRGAARR
jgi:hypothetical protein